MNDRAEGAFAYRRGDAGQPPSRVEPCCSTVLRSPREVLVRLPHTLTEITGPAGTWDVLTGPALADLTRHERGPGEAVGQRIVVSGRVPLRAGSGPVEAPDIARAVFGRGLLKRLATRFEPPDGDGLADDPILAPVPGHVARL
ncbi:peptidase associated/transthyretin-like domain-containing protein [Methylobacterium planeticum]|uniref:Protocatechuate 3,4-dioxygenase beta subunit N-terminal domain-containing protein n=1 Tax=Methylobacterium planeticum TaxID=2615211 RepID=A0A6N6MT87_9HYPH|nr:hypothetical protein [Methylobacterium planeticum]KAB1074611.1 hypothetical protein F6X51_05620 [Methylobacterium planeticum]